MIDFHTSRQLSQKIEKLIQRYELFQLLKADHMRWINTTNDPKERKVNGAIVVQLDALMEQYNVLVNALYT